MAAAKGREVLRGKLSYRKKGNSTWKKRAVAAYCGLEDKKSPAAQILLFEDYEKAGQKPKNTLKLENAKIDSSYSSNPSYSTTIASPHGGVRLSVSPGGYSSSGSGSGVIGSDSGSGTVGGNHIFSVVTKSGDVHEFRTDTENERLHWVKLLQLLIMYPRSTIPEEPKTNPIKESMKSRLETKQYGANSVWPVYILPEEVGTKCNIIGINILALKSGIQGKQVGTLSIYNSVDPTSPIITWDRDKMRRTGKTGNLVFIEIGRRCEGGPGLVWMYAGFNDAQALRETLHNFLFKGDGNAVPIHTTPRLYDSPRASFDANFHPAYNRENSISSFSRSNPILSRSQSQDHDSGFVGSPGSFTSPKLAGPPVRLDKHPSIKRKRDSSEPRVIRRSSSTNSHSPMGSFNEHMARSGDSICEDGSSSGQQSRSHSPQDDCDGDVVGTMDSEPDHHVPMYEVVHGDNSLSANLQKRMVVNGAEYETMVHPKSGSVGPYEEYVRMNKAPMVQPQQSNPISVPQPQSYHTLQHFPGRQSPQNSAGARNNYDTLPTIREAPKPVYDSPSNYENHPLPHDVKDTPSQVYTPDYVNVDINAEGVPVTQENYENVNSNESNNAGKRLSIRRRDSDRESVQLPMKNGSPPSIGGVKVENSPPKIHDNYVQFVPRNTPAFPVGVQQ